MILFTFVDAYKSFSRFWLCCFAWSPCRLRPLHPKWKIAQNPYLSRSPYSGVNKDEAKWRYMSANHLNSFLLSFFVCPDGGRGFARVIFRLILRLLLFCMFVCWFDFVLFGGVETTGIYDFLVHLHTVETSIESTVLCLLGAIWSTWTKRPKWRIWRRITYRFAPIWFDG